MFSHIRSTVFGLAFAFIYALLPLISCTKEYMTDAFIGDYTFKTVGKLSAYELSITDGITHPTGDNELFILETVSGTAKIFRSTGEAENSLKILVEYDNGETVVLDANVSRTNNLDISTYTRNVRLYEESGKNITYDGRLSLTGTGGNVDGILSIKIFPKETFDIGTRKYGFMSGDIMTIATKQK